MISKQNKVLIESSILGGIRGAIGLPYQHPFETLKTVMQAKGNKNYPIRTAQQIYGQYGIRGFYSGFIPNLARVILKQIYRFPLMLYLPEQSNKLYKKFTGKDLNSKTKKTATGLGIAFIEVFFLTPTERLKVWLMTRRVRQYNIRYFFRHSNTLAKDLFKGLSGVFLKQSVSWVSFLVADDIIKHEVRSYRNIPNTIQLSYTDLMFVGAGVGFVNTACIMPFDSIKTQLQKQGATNASIKDIVKTLYKNGGIAVLYSGWQVRYLHYMVQSLLTVALYDYLETSFKKAKN